MIIRCSIFKIAFVCAAAVFSISGICQTQVFVTVDGGRTRVVDMEGNVPIIYENGRRMEADPRHVSLSDAGYYTDGGITVLDKRAGVGAGYVGDGAGLRFRFRVNVKAERDFEDCFILFIIQADEGTTYRKLTDIGDVDAGKQTIDVNFEANFDFGKAKYGYFIYSQGEEIRVYDPFKEASLERARKAKEAATLAAKSQATSAKKTYKSTTKKRRQPYVDATAARVLRQEIPRYPKSLQGTNISGVTKIVYTMDEQGQVFEILDIKSDHPAFLYAAREAVLNSRYRPSVYEGQRLVTTLSQTFAFNEFVCFAEGVEIIPYPEVKNREPFAVYGPNREELADRLEKLAGKQVELELMVNELGQVVSVGASGLSKEKMDQAFNEAFSGWVFLPSVNRGIAYPKRLSLVLADNR